MSILDGNMSTKMEPGCDWQCYLDHYNDLQEALGKNNVSAAEEHYVKRGKEEGRDCSCSGCDWQCYLNRYDDLQKIFGKTNVAAARRHYAIHGKKEGRDCRCSGNASDSIDHAE